jgi:glycosyltransferase involved in cell wall biosynthesis
MSVTVGIPVYNEEDLLRPNTLRLLDYLGGRYGDVEVIIGSNGSTDRTVEIGEALAAEVSQVRFFHLPEAGVGRAFRRFTEMARHERLVSMDMDLAVDLSFIDAALERLDTCDIVVGSKMTGSQKRSRFRRLGSEIFVGLASSMLGIEFVDFSIGAKAYRTPLVRRYASLISHGSAYVLDLVYYVHRDGGRVVQIPVACEDYRQSKFNLGREAVHKFANLARLWWRRRARVA